MTEGVNLGDRMKRYEAVSRGVLVSRMPVIVRVDGKNFSSLTRSMNKPFDERFAQCMHHAAMQLAIDAQNCRVVYHQSDEISLLLTDFKTLSTEGWFNNEIQKVASIAAATATAAFAVAYSKFFPERFSDGKFPVFDGRCFNIPREDVTNYFVWRQRDCERNSVAMLAQAHFSHSELKGRNRSEMMDMLMLRKGVNWNDCPTHFKRGSLTTRVQLPTGSKPGLIRSKWVIEDAPIFSQDRECIEKYLRDDIQP